MPPHPDELLRAWQDAIREITRTAGSLVGRPGEVASEVLAPLQRQTELLGQLLERQLTFERDLAARAVAPAKIALELLRSANEAYHAQAQAFRAASVSFGRLAELMEQQAELIERATSVVQDPFGPLRSSQPEDPKKPT